MSELVKDQEVYVKVKVRYPKPDEDGDIELVSRCSAFGPRSFFVSPEEIVTALPTECEHFEVTGDKVTTGMEMFLQGFAGGWSEVIDVDRDECKLGLAIPGLGVRAFSSASDVTYMARYKKKPATAEEALAKLGHDEEERRAILDGLRDSGFTVERVTQ